MFLTGKLRSRLNSHFRVSLGKLVSVDIADERSNDPDFDGMCKIYWLSDV
jgi:hypothetical protein